MKSSRYTSNFLETTFKLFVCSREEFQKKFKEYDVSDADGLTFATKYGIGIWLKSLDLNDPYDIATFSHELIHAIDIAAKVHDIELLTKDPPSSETFAYLMSELQMNLLKKLICKNNK